MPKPSRRRPSGARVPLGRALSKLGILSRAQSIRAIVEGRVQVDGRVITRSASLVDPAHVRITIDGREETRATWRAILFHKPRGVLTTRTDPEGRPTIYDALGETARGLIAVGRLDRATAGLLLMTTDTRLANWIADPANAVPRTYVVSVRGRVDDKAIERLTSGIGTGQERMQAHAVTLRKASGRESHLIVELREGRNREVRRLFEAVGHEVTRLKRVALGRLELGALAPGEWRELSRDEIHSAFSGAPLDRFVEQA